MGTIKKLITIAAVVVGAYFLYKGAVWGYNELVRSGSSVQRGEAPAIVLPYEDTRG